MIFRLEYCNKFGDVARVDIETPTGTGVEEIRGTGNPFKLQYKTEATDKRGRFMTSSAEINIYENALFNIDTLKTSNETDIKVSYYVNEVLTWSGFVIPDFFSKEIKQNSIVSMTASDRINTLKSATLDFLYENMSIRELTSSCLNKTGLTLPLKTMADFDSMDTPYLSLFMCDIQTQRFLNDKNKTVSCYDILESILILSNSQIVQREGVWQIVNKYQLEIGNGDNYNSLVNSSAWIKSVHNFDFVRRGARRTITPVASSVSVLHEYGGSRSYPNNHDFKKAGVWSAKNGFIYSRDNREIKSFTSDGSKYIPNFGSVTEKYYLLNSNSFTQTATDYLNTQPYLQSQEVPILYEGKKIQIDVEINATSVEANLASSGLYFNPERINYAVIAKSTTTTLVLNNEGKFVPLSNLTSNIRRIYFELGEEYPTGAALTKTDIFSGVLEVEDGLVSDYKIHLRIYGGWGGMLRSPTAINFIKFTVSTDQQIAKGTLYKTTSQGGNFTKEHKEETTIFGDYLTKGLNGYFYDYPSDDTSSILQNDNTTELWTAPNETIPRPLIQQVTRQKARIFSVAHDIIRGDIDVKNFDPLAIFKDCNNKEYVVVSAEFDFLRSVASVEIEEIAYKNIDRRDYIYSYFD